MKFADDSKLGRPVNIFEGRASAQGPRQGHSQAGGMGQQVSYVNQQQIPSPAPEMEEPLGTAETGNRQVGTTAVGEAPGCPGVQQDDHEPVVCPDIEGGKWHLGIYCWKHS